MLAIEQELLDAAHFYENRARVKQLLLLLEPGLLNINLQSAFGCTTLHTACRNGWLDVIQILLEQDADVNIQNVKGFSVLHEASRNGHNAVVLLLLARNADINAKDREGRTPLWHAGRKGRDTVVHTLLEHNADVNICDEKGWAALHKATWTGHERVVAALLEHNADIDVLVPDGRQTALHLAVRLGYAEVVAVLLDHGASTSIKDSAGKTPLEVATSRGNLAIVELLVDAISKRDEDVIVDRPKNPQDCTDQKPVLRMILRQPEHSVATAGAVARNPDEPVDEACAAGAVARKPEEPVGDVGALDAEPREQLREAKETTPPGDDSGQVGSGNAKYEAIEKKKNQPASKVAEHCVDAKKETQHQLKLQSADEAKGEKTNLHQQWHLALEHWVAIAKLTHPHSFWGRRQREPLSRLLCFLTPACFGCCSHGCLAKSQQFWKQCKLKAQCHTQKETEKK